MPDQTLAWTDPTNGYANEVEILYTDTAGGTPDTVLLDAQSNPVVVSMGTQQYTVPDADAPVGRRFAVRGVNTDPDPDVDGPLSNVVEVVAAETWQSNVLAHSPAFFLRLGESSGTTAQDASSNNRGGTYSGGYTLGITGAVSGDSAVLLNGTTGKIDLGSYTGPTGSASFTAIAFVKTTASGDQFAIFHWGTTTLANNGEAMRIVLDGVNAPSGESRLRVEVNGGYCYGSTDLSDGAWHMIGVRLPDAGSSLSDLDLFVDFAPDTVASISDRALNVVAGDPVRIGYRNDNGATDAKFFDGSLDEVALFESALTDTEIANLDPNA